MEEKIADLLDLLRRAKSEAKELKANFGMGSGGEIDAYFLCSNIEKAIGHLHYLNGLCS